MLRRLGLIFAAVAASLAFAASAQAAPTTPGLKPIPYWVCDSTLPISWTTSTPDPVRHDRRLPRRHRRPHHRHVPAKFTSALGTTLTGLDQRPPLRRPRARASRSASASTLLGSAGDTFMRLCLRSRTEILNRTSPTTRGPSASCAAASSTSTSTTRSSSARSRTVPLPQERFEGLELDEQGGIIIIGGLRPSGQSSGSHQRRGAISSCIFCGPYDPWRSGAAAADRRAGPPTPPTGARCPPSR